MKGALLAKEPRVSLCCSLIANAEKKKKLKIKIKETRKRNKDK